MSMTRTESIKHFHYAKYTGMTIAQALSQAPVAVNNGLHAKDHSWVAANPDLDAYEAVQRLHARGAANPDGTCTVVPRPVAA